jgi:uroporphyrinogen-III synthase
VRLLLTRPQAEAERTAAALRARGHTPIVAPILSIEAVAGAEIGAGSWAAVAVTSGNAAQALAGHPQRQALLRLPAFAVGERSAQAMRAAGFGDVTSADGGLAELARVVAARVAPGAAVLYLAGERRSGDLAGQLRTKGIVVQTVILYRAVAATTLPAAIIDALLTGVDGVAHFSRRSAEAYVDAARRAGLVEAALKPVQFCLSEQIGQPLSGAGAAIVRVAQSPAEAALIDLIELGHG